LRFRINPVWRVNILNQLLIEFILRLELNRQSGIHAALLLLQAD
jgi:hypothetical protein